MLPTPSRTSAVFSDCRDSLCFCRDFSITGVMARGSPDPSVMLCDARLMRRHGCRLCLRHGGGPSRRRLRLRVTACLCASRSQNRLGWVLSRSSLRLDCVSGLPWPDRSLVRRCWAIVRQSFSGDLVISGSQLCRGCASAWSFRSVSCRYHRWLHFTHDHTGLTTTLYVQPSLRVLGTHQRSETIRCLWPRMAVCWWYFREK